MNNSNDIVSLVLKECKALEKILNVDLMQIYTKLHNIDFTQSVLSLKQEMVADNGFFDKKKHYAMHIINNEGVVCDETLVRGICTRRSDYSEMTKLKMEELLTIILKSDTLNFKKINEFINDTRVEILTKIAARETCVSRPASFKRAESEYKKVPYQVNAMKLWNTMEYEYFVEGTKGYLFRILGIDNLNSPKKILDNIHNMTNKDKSIVIPFEESHLPEYYIIDEKNMIKICWDDRVQSILMALKGNLNKKTENDIFSEDCFYG